MPNEERPVQVWISPQVLELVRNADALSMTLVVFRNGAGTVNGERAVPFVSLPPGYRLIGPAEAAVLEAAADINVRWLESYVNIIVPTQADPQAFAFAQAELARRQQPPEKGREPREQYDGPCPTCGRGYPIRNR